ncbi:MAG: 16S rRNA (adenine(1518)-N(6)/adenine(1519)-N(6))-dimethyltransferase RsmA [Acidobacteria bacterium]|jgi:16S rRNA (adenine1518-N6/adenine1519-N6)-dimethyltransferase|nr:16S rRNA (adenine(1518)-N(6)/adenine(1519)-N(6))-dimethyltransferase RsmA [Acidobacteriota bacterium]
MPDSRRPKLGQHFLSEGRYRQRIVDSLHLKPQDVVVEIGPGRGAMTELLAQRARRVIGIEVDPRLAEDLRRRFVNYANLEILYADILKTDLAALSSAPGLFVFGNLPYYITSPILHHVLSFSPVIRSMAFVVQREVADRLVAAPGRREYGYLSVLVQSCSRARILFTIPPGAFRPAPKVHSALVRFDMRPPRETPPPEFFEFVKRCFAHKRKKLLGNLGGFYGRRRVEDCIGSLALPVTLRAEEMSLVQFKALFEALRPTTKSP